MCEMSPLSIYAKQGNFGDGMMNPRYFHCEHGQTKDGCQICHLQREVSNINALLDERERTIQTLRSRVERLQERVVELEEIIAIGK